MRITHPSAQTQVNVDTAEAHNKKDLREAFDFGAGRTAAIKVVIAFDEKNLLNLLADHMTLHSGHALRPPSRVCDHSQGFELRSIGERLISPRKDRRSSTRFACMRDESEGGRKK